MCLLSCFCSNILLSKKILSCRPVYVIESSDLFQKYSTVNRGHYADLRAELGNVELDSVMSVETRLWKKNSSVCIYNLFKFL